LIVSNKLAQEDDMLDFLNTLKDTPIPTILVVAGIVFILLAIAGQLEILKTPPLVSLWQKWLAGTVGSLFLIAGLLIYLLPISPLSSQHPSPGTPTATNTSQPTPTLSSTAPAPLILYQADWSTGKAGWNAPSLRQSDAAWSVSNGELMSDGRTVADPNPNGFSTIQAPYHPGDHEIQDYAVEAEILVKSEIPNKAENSFGLGVRRYFDAGQNQDQGYGWRVVDNTQGNKYIALYLQPATIPPGGSTTFNPGNGWHTYRIEVRGSDITVFVDMKTNPHPVLHITDGSFTHGGSVEIWEEFDQIIVRSFTILALS
jgi:hypothetical protein